jgi:hypothetical protein
MKLRFIHLLIMACSAWPLCLASEIIFQTVPNGGIQPWLVTDKEEGIHLLYFVERDPDKHLGHLYYSQYSPRGNLWSAAVQVTTRLYPRSQIIARPVMAVDDDLGIHVTWHMDRPGEIFPSPAWYNAKPEYLYTRSLNGGSSFEQERSLVNEYVTAGAEAGAALALDGDTVALVWHGGNSMTRAVVESSRTVYRILSQDNGNTFGNEERIGNQDLGACACCGLSADYFGKDNLLIAYRTAIGGDGRHMQLLNINNDAISRKTTLVQPWVLNACPVTTSSLAPDSDGIPWLVFESQGKVLHTKLGQEEMISQPVRESARQPLQKHPVMAFNKSGEKLIVWNEGGNIYGGGYLKWQVFDTDGKPLAPTDSDSRKIPAHSAPAVTALENGAFLIMY